jgi:hypothetical protein
MIPEKDRDIWNKYVTERLSPGINGKKQGRMANLSEPA